MVPADTRSTTFIINIINDDISECNESFKLTLSVPSSTCGVVSRGTNTTEVTIKDDDGRRSVSSCVVLCYSYTDQQEQCCHLTNHNILLKRTLLHYQLV